jgi:hypothetical protein
VALFTENCCTTWTAALNAAFPGWSKTTKHVPVLVNVTTAPPFVHAPDAVMITVKPELAVAVGV